MADPITTTITIPKALFDQAKSVAQQLNLSADQLFEMALDQFIKDKYQKSADEDTKSAKQIADSQLVINQGDIFWVQLDDPSGTEPGIPHPHVVVQENVLNHSRILTVVACALTTNIKRAAMPGNVLLEVGEANLPKPSIVEASKVSTVDKAQLGDYIGTLSQERINQILAGMRFLQNAFFAR